MKRVLKWPVPLDDQWHDIGTGLPCLVGEQGDATTALVWTIEPTTPVPGASAKPWSARVFGTGDPSIPDDAIHLGSYQSRELPLVWHVFAVEGIS